MTRLHPNFFPTPLENEDSKEDPPQWIHKKIGFLTKDDLATLWNKHAGSHLHRGSARNILKNDKKMNFNDITKWRDKIINLLKRHIIISPDEKYISYFIMNDGNGNVHSAVFARQD